jgi:hypothetical protein
MPGFQSVFRESVGIVAAELTRLISLRGGGGAPEQFEPRHLGSYNFKVGAGSALISCVLLLSALAATAGEIHDAAREGNIGKVKSLLEANPKLAEAALEDGMTALHLAALEGHAAIARLLLEHHAPINARGPRGETPLHLATYGGHSTVAEVLLEQGADLQATNAAGETALHLAARKGHTALAELFVESKADLQAPDRQGFTPLHSAAEAGHSEIVKLLLEHKTNAAARNKSGKTPAALAAERGHQEVVKIFQDQMDLVQPSAADLAGGATVGELSDLELISFKGNKTFSAEELRAGLSATPDFLELSHPYAPRDEYLAAIERKLQLGYQHTGFPEAQIKVRYHTNASRVAVTIVEGRRYVCGGVKVAGAKNMNASAIIERLSVTNKPSTDAEKGFQFLDQFPPAKTEKDTAEPDCLWLAGEPAHFSEIGLRRMTEDVTQTLRQHGFFFPKVHLKVQPDPSAGRADLQVEISEEGPRGVLNPIEVTGNHKNTREGILRYLDLKPGAELTSERLDAIQNRLWHSARFLTNALTLGAPDADGHIPLRIHLAEFDAAPRLDEDFSPRQTAMLKLREWLSKWGEREEDLVVSVSGFPFFPSGFDVVLSPRGGLAVVERAALTNPPAGGIVVAENRAAYYAPARGRKLAADPFNGQFRTFIILEGKEPEEGETGFHLMAGGGFNSLTNGSPNAARYCCQLTMAPVCCLHLAEATNGACWMDGSLLIRSNSDFVFKLDAKSGRPIELLAKVGQDEGVVRARFEAGTLKGLAARLQRETASFPNSYDTNGALGSITAFALSEALASTLIESQLRKLVSSETLARLPALIQKLKLGEILSPLNALFKGASEGASGAGQSSQSGGGFLVPEALESPEAAASSSMGMIGSWMIQHSREIFPARSWPCVVVREAGFALRRSGGHLDESLKGVFDSPETGPVGFWVMAQVLSGLGNPEARWFAARGLGRLSAYDFRRDCQVLLDERSLCGQCLNKLAMNLRDLDERDLEGLAALQSPANAKFLREAASRLRQAKAAGEEGKAGAGAGGGSETAGPPGVLKAIGPALDEWWDKELRVQFAKTFREIANRPQGGNNTGR